MVTKKKSTGEKEEKKGRVKVGKLKLNRETVTNLTGGEQKKIQGGMGGLRTAGCQGITFKEC